MLPSSQVIYERTPDSNGRDFRGHVKLAEIIFVKSRVERNIGRSDQEVVVLLEQALSLAVQPGLRFGIAAAIAVTNNPKSN
jgi:hypothetical protein